MKLIEKRTYFSYIILGSLYLVSKAIYYFCGFVCPRGVVLGLIAAVVTILIGVGSFKEYKKAGKPIAHWLAIIGPLFILLYTPLHMAIRLGIAVFQFPVGNLIVLVTFECLAIAQLILAVLMYKGLMLKRECGNHKNKRLKSK